jgi:predicted flap endonuclease-1-like 5' DNA nuclease
LLQREEVMAMTFMVPDSDGKGSGPMAGLPMLGTLWRDWSGALRPDDLAINTLKANAAIVGTVFDMMLLPLIAMTGGSEVEIAVPEIETPVSPAVSGATVIIDANGPGTSVPPTPLSVSPAPGRIMSDDVAGIAPALLMTPDGTPDDLLLIKGIGPKLNQLLNNLGIWHYRQIVSWTPAEVAWVNAKIDFKGRIQRERWQPQAAELMKLRKAA